MIRAANWGFTSRALNLLHGEAGRSDFDSWSGTEVASNFFIQEAQNCALSKYPKIRWLLLICAWSPKSDVVETTLARFGTQLAFRLLGYKS